MSISEKIRGWLHGWLGISVLRAELCVLIQGVERIGDHTKFLAVSLTDAMDQVTLVLKQDVAARQAALDAEAAALARRDTLRQDIVDAAEAAGRLRLEMARLWPSVEARRPPERSPQTFSARDRQSP